MGAIVLKYVQLICVAFFMKNSNCAQITDTEEASHLKISTCIAECQSSGRYNKTIVSIKLLMTSKVNDTKIILI